MLSLPFVITRNYLDLSDMVVQYGNFLVNKRQRYEVRSLSVRFVGTKGTERRISSTGLFAILGIYINKTCRCLPIMVDTI